MYIPHQSKNKYHSHFFVSYFSLIYFLWSSQFYIIEVKIFTFFSLAPNLWFSFSFCVSYSCTQRVYFAALFLILSPFSFSFLYFFLLFYYYCFCCCCFYFTLNILFCVFLHYHFSFLFYTFSFVVRKILFILLKLYFEFSKFSSFTLPFFRYYFSWMLTQLSNFFLFFSVTFLIIYIFF